MHRLTFSISQGLYGGFGAAKGGIFPEVRLWPNLAKMHNISNSLLQGFKLASAITATGRGWICAVKRIIESTMWVANDQRWGIGDKPDDASYVRIVYGDTVRVFECTT